MNKEDILQYKVYTRLIEGKRQQIRQEQEEMKHFESIVSRITTNTRQLSRQYIADLQKVIQEAEGKQKEVLAAIQNIEDEEVKSIFLLRFIEGKTKEKVAEELYLTEMTVYRYTSKGFRELGVT